MKTKKRKRSRKLFFVVLAFAPLFIWGFRNMKATDFTSNVAQTSVDSSDQNLRTRFFNSSPETVVQMVQTLAPTLKTYGQNWKIASTNTKDATTTLKCHVRVLVFVDDLQVSVRAENGRTRVDVRSQSRVGRGDFGENRRHIAQLLQQLDKITER